MKPITVYVVLYDADYDGMQMGAVYSSRTEAEKHNSPPLTSVVIECKVRDKYDPSLPDEEVPIPIP